MILRSTSSSAFGDSFIPTPSPSEASNSNHIHREPIPLPETAATLDILLQFVYPFPPPTLKSPSRLHHVLVASLKYSIPSATAVLRAQLVAPHFFIHQPLHAYTIACQLGLEREAKEASRATLRLDLMEIPPEELEELGLSVRDWQRLVVMHRRRSWAMKAILQSAGQDIAIRCSFCYPTPSTRTSISRHTRHLSLEDHTSTPSHVDRSSQHRRRRSSIQARQTPGWLQSFIALASSEVDRRPNTEQIFSMRFLQETVVKSECDGCASSLMGNWEFLEGLKAELDACSDSVNFDDSWSQREV